MHPFEVGTIIGGYTIGRLLAEGGMAWIYQAKSPRARRPVALKILRPEYNDNEEYRERFAYEAGVMRSLRHPHIVPVYASGEENGMLYFAMRLVRGPSLAELLSRRRFSPLTAWQILNPIAKALDFAHENRIVHRDIKPGNILVESRLLESAKGENGENGEGINGKKPKRGHHVYLTDFGLCQSSGAPSRNRDGFSLGTPQYMSPEQVLDERLMPASDVYSLGVVVYEMLLGKLPFDAPRPRAIAFKHVRQTPPPPRSLRPDFPGPLEAVLMRALAKRPKDRFDSAGEFSLDYAHAVQEIAPEARRIEFW
jgi:serine/threonine protein kinase